MSYPGGWRPHIEGALCLDLRRMFESGALREGATMRGRWHWTTDDGEEVSAIGYTSTLDHEAGTLTLDYTCADGDTDERKPVTCTIGMDTVPCHYGGKRWYFRCPYIHRRALKLYKFHGINQFCHREAIRPRPTYASQRVGGYDRIMAQRWAIRRKLGDTFSDLCGEPSKPKGMHWRTFERYLERDNELAEREEAFLLPFLARLGMGMKDF
ncbi:MAG TPA: hypothetical protein VFL78_00610 [Rhodanobacteraceae bacterium]|nr:hypothetical protein [Rhodanobacteraceae bacterium]